ncbi:hypothetical protein GCM10009827_072360 [Dactylosporangium maewongense]|uniref:Uncharacterized protein n=1 Tax=Dactylosporangium maewongense TaxID=634393 RepID=A0ABP4MEE8_9ACTN
MRDTDATDARSGNPADTSMIGVPIYLAGYPTAITPNVSTWAGTPRRGGPLPLRQGTV